MVSLKRFGNLLIVLGSVAVSMFGHANSTTCGEVEPIPTDGQCEYQKFGTLATANEAKSCCTEHLTYLMPRSERISDLMIFFKNATDGPYMTSFSIVASRLQIDGIPVAESLKEKWRNGQQPTGNVPCVGAEYRGYHDYQLYAADCSDPFKALCIRVTENCSCDEEQECVGQFTNVCEAVCQNQTVVDQGPTEGGGAAGSLTELVVPIVVVLLFILVIGMIVIRREKIRRRIQPRFPQPELPITTPVIEETHIELPA